MMDLKRVDANISMSEIELAESLYIAWLAHKSCVVTDDSGLRRYKYSLRKLSTLLVPEAKRSSLAYMAIVSGYDHCITGLMDYLRAHVEGLQEADNSVMFATYYQTRAHELLRRAESELA